MVVKMNWDRLGIATSVACAIHCALLPLIFTSFPVFGINLIHNAIFEWMMIALAFFVGLYSLKHGYLKHHRSVLPVLLFTAGFAMLLTKQFFHSYEYYLLFPAVVLMIGAHYKNYRLCQVKS